MILYVNACPRQDSRTAFLAHKLLDSLGEYEEITLKDVDLRPLSEERLNRRTALLQADGTEHPMFTLARQFAAADTVVIAAPYWDFSFPSLLKLYIENIYAVGIVSRYSEEGVPVGLCRAEKLYYVTTAGGPYDGRFSFDYIKTLAQTCFGISEVNLIKAEMLDVAGFNAEALLQEAVVRYGLA